MVLNEYNICVLTVYSVCQGTSRMKLKMVTILWFYLDTCPNKCDFTTV